MRAGGASDGALDGMPRRVRRNPPQTAGHPRAAGCAAGLPDLILPGNDCGIRRPVRVGGSGAVQHGLPGGCCRRRCVAALSASNRRSLLPLLRCARLIQRGLYRACHVAVAVVGQLQGRGRGVTVRWGLRRRPRGRVVWMEAAARGGWSLASKCGRCSRCIAQSMTPGRPACMQVRTRKLASWPPASAASHHAFKLGCIVGCCRRHQRVTHHHGDI